MHPVHILISCIINSVDRISIEIYLTAYLIGECKKTLTNALHASIDFRINIIFRLQFQFNPFYFNLNYTRLRFMCLTAPNEDDNPHTNKKQQTSYTSWSSCNPNQEGWMWPAPCYFNLQGIFNSNVFLER